MPKVLVVDDIEALHDSYRRRLADKIEILSALTATVARQVFTANPDLAAIAMDACLFGKIPDTIDLVKEFRQSFIGPIIAISGDPEFRQQLLAAGCSHDCEKVDFPKTILRILKL